MRKRTRQIDEASLAALHGAAHGSGNTAVTLRARAVLWFFEGATYVEIRERCGFVPDTVSRWIERFRADGIAGLRGEPSGRRSAPGREQAMAWLPTVIHQSPRSLDIPEDRWTLRTLQQLCHQQTGHWHSSEAMRRALMKLGYSWKRAKQTITSPDPEYERKRGGSETVGRLPSGMLSRLLR